MLYCMSDDKNNEEKNYINVVVEMETYAISDYE